MAAVRDALSFAEEALGIDRLLLRDELRTSGQEILLERLGQLISLSKSGQLALRRILAEYLKRVERDESALPFRLYPLPPGWSQQRKTIVIDPRISFGRPTIAGSGISTEALISRIERWRDGRRPLLRTMVSKPPRFTMPCSTKKRLEQGFATNLISTMPKIEKLLDELEPPARCQSLSANAAGAGLQRKARPSSTEDTWRAGAIRLTTFRRELPAKANWIRPVDVKPLDAYRIWLRCSDGSAGVVDLSDLVGRGVFATWNDPQFFKEVRLGQAGVVAWGEDIELCPDALYMQLTGKPLEEVIPGASVAGRSGRVARFSPTLTLRRSAGGVIHGKKSSKCNQDCTICRSCCWIASDSIVSRWREIRNRLAGILSIVVCTCDRPVFESTAVRQSTGPTISTGFAPGKRVLRYAVATGRVVEPAWGAVAAKGKHFAAITDPKEVGPLRRMLAGYSGETLPGRCALPPAPLVFVHPGEPRKAEWAGGAEWWRYTVTKTDTPHMVPSDPPGGREPSQATSFDRTRPLRLP